MEVRVNLKELRLSKGLKQKELGKLIGVSEAQYSRLENQKSELNYSQISFLCNLFQISSDELLGLKTSQN